MIEIDGSIHNKPEVKEYDEIRQKDLESLGYKVLRFTNYQVLNQLDSVIAKIKSTLHPK